MVDYKRFSVFSFLLFFFFVSFVSFVSLIPFSFSAVLVDISSSNSLPNSSFSYFPGEVVDLTVQFFNSGSEAEFFSASINVQDGLFLFNDYRISNSYFLGNYALSPGELVSVPFKVWVDSEALSGNSYSVSIHSGKNSLNNVSSLMISVVDSPLQLDSKLNTPVLDLFSESALFVSYKNISDKKIRLVESFIASSPGLIYDSNIFLIESLEPNESFLDKEFNFESVPSSVGSHKLIFVTNFMLDSVPHRIEHIYDVEVQDRSAILNSILIFVLVLLILAIFVRFVFKGKSSQVSGTEVKIKN